MGTGTGSPEALTAVADQDAKERMFEEGQGGRTGVCGGGGYPFKFPQNKKVDKLRKYDIIVNKNRR